MIFIFPLVCHEPVLGYPVVGCHSSDSEAESLYVAGLMELAKCRKVSSSTSPKSYSFCASFLMASVHSYFASSALVSISEKAAGVASS